MKKIIIYIIIILVILFAIIMGINIYVKLSTKNQIIENEDYSNLKDIDCIIVLGAGIWGEEPSPMLEDRLNVAISLYEDNVSSKIIMSGDHGKIDYDEVNVMKEYAVNKGVPSEDIFMDHAGFSSYETIYRAKDIFKAEKVVIVTQKYHLYRALYIANQLGLEAYGVGADPRQYVGAMYRELREILARDKDFVKCIFKPEPTYLGDTIPVSGNGNVTNDKDNYIAEELDEFYTSDITAKYTDIRELDENYSTSDAQLDNCFVIGAMVHNDNLYAEFMNNYQNKEEAFIRVAQNTIEGDCIIYDIRYNVEDNKILMVKDNTRDEFAAENDRTIKFTKYQNIGTYQNDNGLYWVAYNDEINEENFSSENTFVITRIN